MKSAASEARKQMIERIRTRHATPSSAFKEDAADTEQPSAKEARGIYLAKLRGEAPPAKHKGQYREDHAEHDPLAWYRAHLRTEGYSESKINRLLTF